MPVNNPFDIIKSISKTKEDLSREEGFKENYNQYIINRALARFTDCIMIVNDINMYPYLSDEMHYCYLLNSVRPKARFQPWLKQTENKDLDLVMNYYQCNMKRAKEMLTLLSDKQLEDMRNYIDKNHGGLIKNE